MKLQYETELYHHGVKGQHWHVRRYQNFDGTYTALGRQRRAMGSTIELNIADNQRARAARQERKLEAKARKTYGKLDKIDTKMQERRTRHEQLVAQGKKPANDLRDFNEIDKKHGRLNEQRQKVQAKFNKQKDAWFAKKHEREGWEKQINEQVKQLGREGYTVATAKCKRVAATPKDLAVSTWVFGLIGTAVTVGTSMEEGTKYRVY